MRRYKQKACGNGRGKKLRGDKSGGRVTPQRQLMLVDKQGRTLPLTHRPLVAGRAKNSDIVLKDPRASRRHFLIQATANGWILSDLKSTNGTSINGRPLLPGHVHTLAQGDRIIVGDTVFNVQLVPISEHEEDIAQPKKPRDAPDIAHETHAASPDALGPPLWQWIASAMAIAGVILAGIGTFQPWLKVDVRFTLARLPGGQFLNELLSAVEQAANTVLGVQPLVKSQSISIAGMDAYGEAVLVAGIIILLILVLDLTLNLSRSSLPGIAYVLAALAPIGIIYSEIYRFRHLTGKEVIFGINLLTIIEGAGQFLEIKIVPLTGLYMTGIGLAVLLFAGCFRLLSPLLSRTG